MKALDQGFRDMMSNGFKVVLTFDTENNVYWALLYTKIGDYIAQGVGSTPFTALEVLASRVKK